MNLNQVTLPASDVERAIAFYRSLGLRLIVEALPDYARFECPDGGSTLSLHRLPGDAGRSGITIYFECFDLDLRVAHLKRQGLEFESDPEDKRWLWREARLSDPDGNSICLFWAGENRRNPPWRIDS